MENASTTPLWPLAAHIALAVVVAMGMLGLSFFLGGRRFLPAVGEPYESGIVSGQTARIRLSVKYFRVALFFLIFDLEVVFVVAWALAARELGWPGYAAVLVFIGVLAASLGYLWRVGALDWAGQDRGSGRAQTGRERAR